jgi:hypothetical protein
MKSPRILYPALTASLLLGCAALPLWAGGATNAKTPDPAGTKGKAGAAGTNSANASLPIPVSVFDPTQPPTKDPFFPNSPRRPVTQQGNDKAVPAISASSFTLMATSGSIDSRLAMINHRTLAAGEATEVTIPSGVKVKIRLMQIKDDSVVIRVVSPPQPDLIELSLGNSKGTRVYIGPNDTGH